MVEQHQADQNIFAALTDFVSEVQQEAVSGSQVGSEVSAPSHTLRNVVIAFSVVFVLVVLGFFLIARPSASDDCGNSRMLSQLPGMT